MLSKFIILSAIFVLSSCTATLNLVNAGGESKDVVDDTMNQSAEMPKF